MLSSRLARAILGGLVLFAAAPAWAETAESRPRTDADCAGLAGLRIEDTNLLSATIVPASNPDEVAEPNRLPAYCRVLGFIRPAINFEIRLPIQAWNGKFYMTGCGVFCGRLDSNLSGFTNAINFGLRRGYAAATMDAGHWGELRWDGRWAWNNRLSEIDWGYRAVHETARVAREVVQRYYGIAPRHRYFAGCSTGGRMALMEAQRYPDDFDGIISGAPALDYTGLVGTFFAWLVQSNTGPDGRPVLDPAQPRSEQVREMVHRAVINACDGRDGQTDELIADPRACDWRPEVLRCTGDDTADCLTAAEVTTLTRWYEGLPRDGQGRQLYPGGLPPGSEPFWPFWLTGPAPPPPSSLAPLSLIDGIATQFLRYMAFAEDPGETYTVAQFNFERDPPRLREMGAVYNAADPDLHAFRDRGGRIILYQGWADAVVTPRRTIDYYRDVEQTMGGRAATQAFLRLFMVPGMDHCGIQPGPGISDLGNNDPLTALDQWVEQGTPPAALVASRRNAAGVVEVPRPLCPYPQVSRYIGSGDPADLNNPGLAERANYDCAEP